MKRFLPSGIMIFAAWGPRGLPLPQRRRNRMLQNRAKSSTCGNLILRRFLKRSPLSGRAIRSGFRKGKPIATAWTGASCPVFPSWNPAGVSTPGEITIFGWANGKSTFDSIGEAIHHVAEVLFRWPGVPGQLDLEAKLHTYNHNIDYKTLVMNVMRQISPTPELESAE